MPASGETECYRHGRAVAPEAMEEVVQDAVARACRSFLDRCDWRLPKVDERKAWVCQCAGFAAKRHLSPRLGLEILTETGYVDAMDRRGGLERGFRHGTDEEQEYGLEAVHYQPVQYGVQQWEVAELLEKQGVPRSCACPACLRRWALGIGTAPCCRGARRGRCAVGWRSPRVSPAQHEGAVLEDGVDVRVLWTFLRSAVSVASPRRSPAPKAAPVFASDPNRPRTPWTTEHDDAHDQAWTAALAEADPPCRSASVSGMVKEPRHAGTGYRQCGEIQNSAGSELGPAVCEFSQAAGFLFSRFPFPVHRSHPMTRNDVLSKLAAKEISVEEASALLSTRNVRRPTVLQGIREGSDQRLRSPTHAGTLYVEQWETSVGIRRRDQAFAKANNGKLTRKNG